MGKLSSISISNQGKKHGVNKGLCSTSVKAYALQVQKQSLKGTKHTDVITNHLKHLQYKEPNDSPPKIQVKSKIYLIQVSK